MIRKKGLVKALSVLVCVFLLSFSTVLAEPCNGDLDCDGDVDGTDAALLKSDFGRNPFNDPCDPCPSESPTPVPKTGQTTQYATGDDGDLQRGVAWPNPRFTDHEDGTVTDNLTGLMWTKSANLPGSGITWQGSLDYVAGMNTDTYENFGYIDWRLPNIREIHSLIEYSGNIPALPQGHPFSNLNILYWSSTSDNNDNSFVIATLSGLIESHNKISIGTNVWPVRGGQ